MKNVDLYVKTQVSIIESTTMKNIKLSSLLMVGIFLSTSTLTFSQEKQRPISTGKQEVLIAPERSSELDCPPFAIFSQTPLSSNTAYYSDPGTILSLEQNLFELFTGLNEDIAGITFWGILYDGGDCYTPGPLDFEISFYADNAGAVGALHQSFPITVTPATTASIISGSTVLQFEVSLPSTLSMTAGWVSVVKQNPTDLPCTFAWVNTTNGDDSFAYKSTDTGGQITYATGSSGDNLSFCLTGIPQVPISNWAILVGILFIGVSMVIRYKRSLA